jgi:hypothetical protein
MSGDGGDEVGWMEWTVSAERSGEDSAARWIPWIRAEAEAGWSEKRKRNPKRMGELSQAAFLLKAQRLGFGLAVPWGDSEKCDFIVWAEGGGRLLRVQVKATGRLNGGGYDVQPVYATRDEGKKCYTAEQIDVLAAHVVMEGDRSRSKAAGEGARSTYGCRNDVWYVLPVGAIAGVKSLRFFPDGKGRNPKWEGYREAWEWLGLKDGGG